MSKSKRKKNKCLYCKRGESCCYCSAPPNCGCPGSVLTLRELQDKPKHKKRYKITRKPLTKAMRKVLERMEKGWQLGLSMGMNSRYWLQKGRCGYGGETEEVNASTAFGLWKRKFIEVDREDYPLTTYKFTPAGRKALKEE